MTTPDRKTAAKFQRVRNYIDGEWVAPDVTEAAPVVNPATGELLGETPLSGAADLDRAANAGSRAFAEWRRMPAGDRIQFLFRLKGLLEQHLDELARIVTIECGKTLAESRGEVRRAIENVEVACGIPSLMQGYNSEDIASGIDEMMIRQPLGVTAVIAPFNFPAMIPFWFFPYAIACGNTCIVKASEKVPLTMTRVFELIEQTALPKGVLSLVNGASEAVDAIIEHPAVRAISFVGSTAVARKVYARAAAEGKRAQCHGGAKNAVVILPDCDFELTTRIVADSAFGCAGQRCLAASLAVAVGEAREPFEDAIAGAARNRVVGNGLDERVEMGPVITPQSKSRIEALIGSGLRDGAKALADGRGISVSGGERGNFVGATVLSGLDPRSETATIEIFGPVLGVVPVTAIEDAIALINSGRYGNMACVFTSGGAAARKFRSEVEAGNIGVNVGVAAPIASFPFSGWKESFFGDMHGQSRDAVEFFTQKKVVVERWPSTWSRRF
jgi:malonate-semialdehyde dehydrogenase (acetylating)/methylmalonate-semialdehyde dehydrogenase